MQQVSSLLRENNLGIQHVVLPIQHHDWLHLHLHKLVLGADHSAMSSHHVLWYLVPVEKESKRKAVITLSGMQSSMSSVPKIGVQCQGKQTSLAVQQYLATYTCA